MNSAQNTNVNWPGLILCKLFLINAKYCEREERLQNGPQRHSFEAIPAFAFCFQVSEWLAMAQIRDLKGKGRHVVFVSRMIPQISVKGLFNAEYGPVNAITPDSH